MENLRREAGFVVLMYGLTAFFAGLSWQTNYGFLPIAVLMGLAASLLMSASRIHAELSWDERVRKPCEKASSYLWFGLKHLPRFFDAETMLLVGIVILLGLGLLFASHS